MDKIYRQTDYVRRTRGHGCRHCGKCVEACPKNVIGMTRILWHRHFGFINPSACIGCGKCVKSCPAGLFVYNAEHNEKG